MKCIDFLDVSLDLENDLSKPYLKPNNSIMCVNVGSNHPPSILKNISENINKRLNSLLKNKEVFDDSIGPYQEALSQAGYQYKLHFDTPKPP